MYVCLCNGISDKKIRAVVHKHRIVSIKELRAILPVGSDCGKCIRQARTIVETENLAPLAIDHVA